MIKRPTKILFIIIASALAASTQAYACDTVDNHRTVLHAYMPDVETIDPEKEFIGEVTLRQKTKWFFFKEDKSAGLNAYVHSSPSHPDLEGQVVRVFPVIETSCGPYVDDGDRGFVEATISPQSDGPDLLFLKTQRVGFSFLQNRPRPAE